MIWCYFWSLDVEQFWMLLWLFSWGCEGDHTWHNWHLEVFVEGHATCLWFVLSLFGLGYLLGCLDSHNIVFWDLLELCGHSFVVICYHFYFIVFWWWHGGSFISFLCWMWRTWESCGDWMREMFLAVFLLQVLHIFVDGPWYYMVTLSLCCYQYTQYAIDFY